MYLLQYLTPTIIFPIALMAALLLFFSYYIFEKKEKSALPAEPDNTLTEGAEAMAERKALSLPPLHSMGRRDIWVMLAITAVYALVAFCGLGDTVAPESFYSFEGEDYTFTLTLDEPTEITEIIYYTGLHTGNYALRWSSDGAYWSETVTFEQSYAKLFNWLYVDFEPAEMKYIQIWAKNIPLEMGELALFDGEDGLIDASKIGFPEAARLLFDEQQLVPEAPGYLNSAYFDEIYHARTAYEHIRNVKPYEVSHPPLGKIIIGIGIRLFGMTPFGWRFMGTLFGVLMLPILYVFLKNLFGRTLIAACGTTLFAFDFMHFVQTRIATIDTYGVFFILAMYLFMYRYIAQDYEAPFRKTALPLFFSGLCFGLGAASKWVVIYGGAGLAILWLIRQILRGRYYIKSGRAFEFFRYEVDTVLFSILSFVIVPAIVYYLSYIPYGLAEGMTLGEGMLTSGEYLKIVVDNQKFMFSYHSKLVAEHPYESPWFSWLLSIRPILYYLEYLPDGTKSAFGAFGNPMVWWGGLIALIYVFMDFFKKRNGRALFIIIGYLSQLVPWMAVSRIVFIYHYFPSTIFLVLALCYSFNVMYERQKGRYKRAMLLYTASALVLFAAFYPVLTGVAVPQWYTTNFLRWIPEAWPF
ncbi:MAG TPA: phospholipid carrier-dependent glycosyltransferase [Clostridiales bacterium]|nr:phospholipid carrier-dependent glycosyltransferase [Clostridiales bacterium]